MKTDCCFFLGSNTPNGFCSLFDELHDESGEGIAYILKGGPGNGKSSLMKAIARKADENSLFCERIYCSSDETSLDAVIIPQLKVCIADGTAPHVIEPKYPGISEILVNLTDGWDRTGLRKNADEIISLNRSIAIEHAKSTRFLSAAGSLLDDSCNIEYESIDRNMLYNYARRIAAREIPTKNTQREGKVSRRFLSAPTPAGLCVHYGSIEYLCNRVIELNGIAGSAASVIIDCLTALASERGYDVYLCLCPMSYGKRGEHLLIPELSLCFFTSDAWHPAPENCEKTVNLLRFSDNTRIKKHRTRLEFNQNASSELITEAMLHTAKAKQLHDVLETYYIAETDYSNVNEKRENLMREIFNQ